MNISKIIELCEAAIPRSVEYSKGEQYGNQNIEDTSVEAKRIAYCVTPSPGVDQWCRDNDIDLLISHHPVASEIPHLIYHTALDCCEGGLNDMWADALGMDKSNRIEDHLGWSGDLPREMSLMELLDLVKARSGAVDGQVYHLGGKIKSVTICTGLGGLVVDQAVMGGTDCYITGELIGPADETGFDTVIETGHTNSEYMGVEFFEKILKMNIIPAPRDIDVYGDEYYRGDDHWALDDPFDCDCDSHEGD